MFSGLKASIELSNLDDNLAHVRRLAATGNFRVTLHAQREMIEDKIRLDDVLSAISNGSVLENYPDHRRGPCCLLHGVDANNRSIHVVCTTASPKLIIITVYCPKPPKWVSPTQRRNRL